MFSTVFKFYESFCGLLLYRQLLAFCDETDSPGVMGVDRCREDLFNEEEVLPVGRSKAFQQAQFMSKTSPRS